MVNAIPPYVKLETSLMSYAFPTEEKNLNNYIFDALGKEEQDFITKYDLSEFPMRVQSLNRTFIDKMFAICDYYMKGKAYRNARHLYDIYKLSEYVTIDDDFLRLVGEVRNHRLNMGAAIAPSAPLDVNILELAQYLSDIQKPVWIRHVLVPTINTDEKYLERLHRFIIQLKNVERIEVLPYHTLGAYKWKELGLGYPLEGIDPPTEKQLQIANTILETGR